MLSLRARRTLIWKRVKHGWTVNKICSHFRINRDTFYYHWNSYKQHGWDGLAIKPRTPHTIHRTPDNVVKDIVRIRNRFNYGPNKIEAYLKQNGISIGHNTIHRILVGNNLNNPIDYQRKTWGKSRFERNHSNSLWQADWKLTDDDMWMITFLDDHSRFVVGSKIDINATAEAAMHLLEKCISKFDSPKQLLTDQGIQFHDTNGISSFTQFCTDNKIEHILASKRRPTTIGKVERWHRTYDEEHTKFDSLRKFVHYYNYVRINQAINYMTPAQVYFRDV